MKLLREVEPGQILLMISLKATKMDLNFQPTSMKHRLFSQGQKSNSSKTSTLAAILTVSITMNNFDRNNSDSETVTNQPQRN